MESTTFNNVFQATNFEKNPIHHQSPLLHDFFAGDSSPEIQIPYEVESSASDCESGVTGSSSTTSTSSATSSVRHRRGIIFDENLAVELTEGERSYELIRRRFLAGFGDTVDIVAVHRRNWSEDYSGPAKIQTFQLYARALESKYGGPPNIKFGWYGGDKHRIEKILAHGFSHLDLQMNNNNNNNHAVCLSPDDSPAQSVSDSGPDEDGLRHVLLCRVLLGESELVRPGSGQTYPSSGKFDSGVDSYDNPKNYVIWSTHMNTHILPEYVVTYKLHSADDNDPTFSKGVNVIKAKNGIKMPTSTWVSFPALIAVLAKYLAPDAISLINKYHKDYKDRRISRPELIQKVRQIAGDKLLIAVIKSFKSSSKGSKVPLGSSYRRSNTNK